MTEILSTATEIVPIGELNLVIAAHKAKLSGLIKQHSGLSTDVSNPTAYAKVKAVWREYYDIRLDIKKKTEGTLADMKSQLNAVKQAAEAVVGEWKAEEDKWKAFLDAEDKRKELVRKQKAEAELERLRTIRAKIDEIRNLPLVEALADSERLAIVLESLESRVLSEAEFAEFQTEATEVLKEAASKLQALLDAKLEQERIAEAQKAEAERLAAERAAFETEQKRIRAEQEAAQREAQAKIDAENARIAAEQAEQRKALEAQQAEIDRQNAAIEAAKREAEREAKAKEDEAIRQAAAAKAKQEQAKREAARLKRLEEESSAEEHYRAHIASLSEEQAWQAVLDALESGRIEYAKDIAYHAVHGEV